MVMNGFDTDGDGENNFYAVNGPAFYYAKYPIRVRRSQLVRIYLANLTEFDLVNSFHLHGDFFRYYPTGSTDQFHYTDTVMLCQGERGIIEIEFANTGLFMFHAHQSEFAELGWMGFFESWLDSDGSAVGRRSREERARRGLARWRLWALVPLLLLVGVVSLFAARGGSLLELVGRNPPPADELDIRRVEFSPGEIRIRVTNPQREAITIATVTVDDAIVPYSVDGPRELGRLRSSTVVVPYDWVEDEPIAVGVTSSTGIQTTEEIAGRGGDARPERRRASSATRSSARSSASFPSRSGSSGCPRCGGRRPEWLAAFMALTGGLLTFLALEALAEALELQAALPGALGGIGLVLLGVATSYLALSFLAQRLSASGGSAGGGVLGGLALATLVAIGIGAHNLGEGLAIGSSFALGELTLGTFLIVGFMVHNVTEGLGIAAPVAEGARAGIGRLAVLALVAGAPTILGAWIGGYVTNDVLAVLFFAVAAGAALQVVVEVARYVARRAPGGLTSGYVVGGFLAGIAIMFVTGLLVG